MTDIKKTREEWLNKLAKAMEPTFKKLGHVLPKYRVSCGFTSAGSNSNAIGECWAATCSKDAVHEIFLHPSMDDSAQVAAVLAHELTHAAVGFHHRHSGDFKVVCTALGLIGPMTSTTAGPEFLAYVAPLIKKIGRYPHASLTSNGLTFNPKGPDKGKLPKPGEGGGSSNPKRPSGKMLKFKCGACGYTVLTTKTWAAVGSPICHCNTKPMKEQA